MTQRVAILAYGSRGDVQPFLALSIKLAQEGYFVRLAAPEIFRTPIEQAGINFAPLPGDPTELIDTLVQEAGWNPLNLMQVVTRYALPRGVAVLNAAREACKDADLILHSFLMTIAGHEIAREHSIPELACQLFPFLPPTRAYPALSFPDLRLGPGYNLITHHVTAGVFWQANRLAYAWLRRHISDLAPLTGWPFRQGSLHRPEILSAISPSILPRPADWDERTHLTGYWFLPKDETWFPPGSLVDFLESGAPPIYIGFGSMIHRYGPEWSEVFFQALRETGLRAVMAAGWGGLDRPKFSDQIYPLGDTPHEWLFPRVAAAVHHGGAGTTGAALRAGIPNVIIPFIADQPFWGRRVQLAGAGPAPIPAKALTLDKLAAAFHQAVNNAAIRETAQKIGEKIKAENGVAQAADVIRTYF